MASFNKAVDIVSNKLSDYIKKDSGEAIGPPAPGQSWEDYNKAVEET